METFEATITWRHDREFCLNARENPDLTVATPPQFGGPDGVWSPEELLVGSVGGCLLSTFLYFADRFQIPIKSYSSTAKGTLDKTPVGLRFTGIDVSIALTVPDEETVERASSLRLKEKLEKYCPVSASFTCPIRVRLDIGSVSPEQGASGGSAG